MSGWMSDAACRGKNTSLFYPAKNEMVSLDALDLCTSCPVRERCLDHALAESELGIWGGTTEQERKRLRRERRIAGRRRSYVYRTAPDHGTTAGYTLHIRNGTPPCHQCRAAHAQRRMELKKERRQNQ